MPAPSEILHVRVPQPLLARIDARAEAAGLARADVARAALVREAERPDDATRSRVVVEAWLAGELDEPAAPENDR